MRLLNSKQRTMGIDTAALDAKVAELKGLKAAEKQEGIDEARRTAEINSFMREREEEEIVDAQDKVLQLAGDWSWQTDRRNRIEADLNPKLPENRMNPIVPEETSVSAAQQFVGEDTTILGRQRQQGLQMTEWADQQVAEKAAARREEREEDLRYVEFTAQINAMRLANEEEEEQQRIDALLRNQEENMALARQKLLQAQYEREENQSANSWEVKNMVNDAKLCEDPAQADSVFGPHRVRAGHWKGMSKAQVSEYHKSNAAKRADTAAHKDDWKVQEKQWAQYQGQINGVLADREREEAAVEVEKRFALRDFHSQQQADNQERETINKQIATGKVTDKWHSGFGSSWR
jgi:hypothetical protein